MSESLTNKVLELVSNLVVHSSIIIAHNELCCVVARNADILITSTHLHYTLLHSVGLHVVFYVR